MSGPQELQEKWVLWWGPSRYRRGRRLHPRLRDRRVIIAVFVRPDLTGPGGWIVRFPDVRSVRTLENNLYLVTLAFWTVHHPALYRALRQESLAPALFPCSGAP